MNLYLLSEPTNIRDSKNFIRMFGRQRFGLISGYTYGFEFKNSLQSNIGSEAIDDVWKRLFG